MDDEYNITKKVYYTHAYVVTYEDGSTRPDTHDKFGTPEEALKYLNANMGCCTGVVWGAGMGGVGSCTIRAIETYKIIRTKDIALDQNKDETTWSLKTAGK